jgi:hypothetical protein
MKNNFLLITAFVALIFIAASISLVQAAAYFPVNSSIYYLHNETDSQFTTYDMLLNASVHAPVTMSGPASFAATQVVTCWNAPGWTSINWTMPVLVNGSWTFNIYTNCSNNYNAAQYFLMAKILKINTTGGFNFVNTSWNGFACANTAASNKTWVYNLASLQDANLSSGERIGIQICTNITAASGGARLGRMYWEGTAPSSIVFPYQYYDNLAPDINFIAPVETSGTYQFRRNIQVNVSASDNVNGFGLGNITLDLYNSTSRINSTNTTDANIFINFTGLADNLYFFNATACDNATNCNSTETRNVTVDNLPPYLINISSPTFTRYNFANISISFNASDALTPINTLFYDNGTANRTYNAPLTLNLSYGNYTFFFYANDTLGNLNFTNVTFTVNGPPSITSLNASPSIIAGGSILTINASVTDPNNDSLSYYCSETSTTPNATNTILF